MQSQGREVGEVMVLEEPTPVPLGVVFRVLTPVPTPLLEVPRPELVPLRPLLLPPMPEFSPVPLPTEVEVVFPPTVVVEVVVPPVVVRVAVVVELESPEEPPLAEDPKLPPPPTPCN